MAKAPPSGKRNRTRLRPHWSITPTTNSMTTYRTSANGMVRPCSRPASDKLARGADKEHAMPATAQTAIAVIGIDIGKNSFSRRGSQ